MATKKFNWRRLALVCRKIHVSLYDNNNLENARTHFDTLKRLLDAIPGEGAIVEAEARALYHELRGDISIAIDWRLVEVSRIESLHQSFAGHDCSDEVKEWALSGYGQDVLEERLELVGLLKRKLEHEFPQN